MSIEKKCGECGKPFHVVPSANERQFCSMKCYHVVRTRKSRKSCPVCGVEMRAWFDYCSRKCSAKAKSTSYDATCNYCGKVFLTKPSSDGKFCSRQCCSDWQRGLEHVDRISKPCAYCGAEIVGTPTELGKKKFCSRSCSDKNKTKEAGHDPNTNRLCVVCGKEFTVYKPCSKQKCCSHKCGGAFQFLEHYDRMEHLLPEIKEYRKSHTAADTAKQYGMSPSALMNWGVIGPEAEKRWSCPDYLTSEQMESIVGNLLGDGNLSYMQEGRNSHFSIGQKADRTEYVMGLYDIYSPFSCGTHERQSRKPSKVDGKINHNLENWNGEYTSSFMMYTVAHPVFTSLRQKWYETPYAKGGRKIVPADLKLTWRTAAMWACDDGSNCNSCPPSRTSRFPNRVFTLYTDSFLNEEVEFLIELLDKNLGIKAGLNRRKGNPLIVMRGDEQYKFVNGIKPFIPWECFQHKCIARERGDKNTSGFRGVSFHKGSKMWRAYTTGQKRVDIGSYKTKEEAAIARQEYMNSQGAA